MRLQFSFLAWMLMLLFLSLVCKAQPAKVSVKPVTWYASANQASSGDITLMLTAVMKEGYCLYAKGLSLNKECVELVSCELTPSTTYAPVGKIRDTGFPVLKYDRFLGTPMYCHEKTVVYTQQIKLNALSAVISGNIRFMSGSSDAPAEEGEQRFEIKINMKDIPVQGVRQHKYKPWMDKEFADACFNRC